jgi:3-oxoacyl-[acyl-carrier protein] reductase
MMVENSTDRTPSDRGVALVTGIVGGIGCAIALQLQSDGFQVVITDRPGPAFDCRLQHTGLAGIPADLGNREEVQQLIDDIVHRYDAPVVVVNAAGGVCGQTGQALPSVTPAQWQQIFAANVDSAFHLAQATLPLMQQRGQGRFITISSGAGLKPSLTGIQAYTAAKHALIGLTRQLAMDYGPFGITVNSIAPGFVLSNDATRRQWDSYGKSGQEQLVNRIYTRRLGQPEDIAHVASFLASDKADWITGQVLQVDGGTS